MPAPGVWQGCGGCGRWPRCCWRRSGWWELRTARRGRPPLLDPRRRRTPGFPAGSGIGLVYFMGFTGVWLVLALFLQDGLGYSPLSSGLVVTPFALGVAASAVAAGRLVPRFGRWLTVCGLSSDGGRAAHDGPAAASTPPQRRRNGSSSGRCSWPDWAAGRTPSSPRVHLCCSRR